MKIKSFRDLDVDSMRSSWIESIEQFLYMSLGSCAELETQIEIALELGYLSQINHDELLEDMDHESKMLRNLIKRL